MRLPTVFAQVSADSTVAGGFTLPVDLAFVAGLSGLAVAALLSLVAAHQAFVFTREVGERGFGIETQWSGFGGGLGGWRMSPAMGFLVAALAFGTLGFLTGAKSLDVIVRLDSLDVAERADSLEALLDELRAAASIEAVGDSATAPADSTQASGRTES